MLHSLLSFDNFNKSQGDHKFTMKSQTSLSLTVAHQQTVFSLVGNDTPQTMADPWSTVPELRLNLCVYILCMVGGLVGNSMVILIMIRWDTTLHCNILHRNMFRQKANRKFHTDTWKTNLFLLSLSVRGWICHLTFLIPMQRCLICCWCWLQFLLSCCTISQFK